MNISPADLRAEVERALARWPFIVEEEEVFELPPWLLFAVGSRETNLTNEVGDGGHGHGVWQLDDHSHTIPVGFDGDVLQQAITAGSMLHGLLMTHDGSVDRAANVYNSGQPYDAGTTGRDYGTDVSQRREWCAANLVYPAAGYIPLREVVAMSIFKSDQDAAAYVTRSWYITYLHREPESPQAQLYWITEIMDKGMDTAYAEFLSTPEVAGAL